MHKLMDAIVRRSGFPLSRTARRSFRYLAQYYPPFYYEGFLAKIVGFDTALRELEDHGVPGDVVECGVGRGLSFYVLAYFMARRSSSRRLYGFDSFEGFPPPSAFDHSSRRPVCGDVWRDTSYRHVAEHFRAGGLQDFFESRVTMVPGFFSTTLPGRLDPAKIALLNLDVDLYESYRECLQHLGPRVAGLVVYDEYAAPKWPGATRAIDEHVPRIRHRLYHSAVMDRFVSLGMDVAEAPWAASMIRALQMEPVERR
jgi:hypothetical protein